MARYSGFSAHRSNVLTIDPKLSFAQNRNQPDSPGVVGNPKFTAQQETATKVKY